MGEQEGWVGSLARERGGFDHQLDLLKEHFDWTDALPDHLAMALGYALGYCDPGIHLVNDLRYVETLSAMTRVETLVGRLCGVRIVEENGVCRMEQVRKLYPGREGFWNGADNQEGSDFWGGHNLEQMAPKYRHVDGIDSEVVSVCVEHQILVRAIDPVGQQVDNFLPLAGHLAGHRIWTGNQKIFFEHRRCAS
ncbi:hypothetical protein N7488_000150 [Penicillium malachiteum]|nr:hypothetical protein N7488_000150 [Penicillium malachiteum]